MGFRESILEFAPRWLVATNGGGLLRSFGAVVDSFTVQLKDGIKARLPDYAPADALGYIGTDRSMTQGPSETDANFRSRLIGAVPANKKRGSAMQLLKQLAGYFHNQGEPGLRTVSNGRVWHEYDWATATAYKTVSGGDWNWDGNDDAWHRGWVILEGETSLVPSYRAAATSGNTTGDNPTVSIAAVANDLLVVFCAAAGNTNASPTCTDDADGLYTLIDAPVAYDTSGNRLSAFVRNKVISTTATVIITVAVGTNTSVQAAVVAVANVGRGGKGVIRSRATQANQAGATTPAPVLNANAETVSLTISAVANLGGVGGAATATPGSWTSRTDTGQATPNNALKVVTRDSGFTGTTITWGGASATAFASYVLEISSKWCRAPITFGSGGGTFDDGSLFGCSGINEEDIATIQQLVQTWKPANVYANRIIATFDRFTFERKGGSKDIATEPLTGYWINYDGGTWEGVASAGASGSRNLSVGTAPAIGANFGTHASADFNGSTHSLSTALLTSSFLSATRYYMEFIFNADTAGATNANPFAEEAIFAEGSGNLYVTFTTSGVRAGHYDGAYKATDYIACSTGANHVVQVWYDGTRIWCRVDGGTPTNVLAGSPTSIAGVPYLGRNWDGTAFFDGKIAMAALMDTLPNLAKRISFRAFAQVAFNTIAHAATIPNPAGNYDDPANWTTSAVFLLSGGEEPS